eukprot:CAMPEP_0174385084 /NCGR_PEP_ID=MMETSP0811_2-20130205/126353_1 /TAXON_ID=73025 ORGANISM="Eutreptiella gymnastica-like, Strain CCMP1594" /NCGR_SAMPLE_ID=MMETSP0811_2 /ASSEMBLY_ACC=CAM_ASM_000667 /LENGTH=60 /DNA_ID=CAMNT_0015539263 /DNA_START=1923 /DNA_END=2102 /DNA_ORIENTATION=+
MELANPNSAILLAKNNLKQEVGGMRVMLQHPAGRMCEQHIPALRWRPVLPKYTKHAGTLW